jgi:hypothetical protein
VWVCLRVIAGCAGVSVKVCCCKQLLMVTRKQSYVPALRGDHTLWCARNTWRCPDSLQAFRRYMQNLTCKKRLERSCHMYASSTAATGWVYPSSHLLACSRIGILGWALFQSKVSRQWCLSRATVQTQATAVARRPTHIFAFKKPYTERWRVPNSLSLDSRLRFDECL